MINKIVDQVSQQIQLEHEFKPASLCLKTTTWIAGKPVHVHHFDLNPIFEEFKKRLEDDK